MGLLDLFRTTHKGSASVAKERLQILVAHDRAERNRPSYLPKLQKEILEVGRGPAGIAQTCRRPGTPPYPTQRRHFP